MLSPLPIMLTSWYCVILICIRVIGDIFFFILSLFKFDSSYVVDLSLASFTSHADYLWKHYCMTYVTVLGALLRKYYWLLVFEAVRQ